MNKTSIVHSAALFAALGGTMLRAQTGGSAAPPAAASTVHYLDSGKVPLGLRPPYELVARHLKGPEESRMVISGRLDRKQGGKALSPVQLTWEYPGKLRATDATVGAAIVSDGLTRDTPAAADDALALLSTAFLEEIPESFFGSQTDRSRRLRFEGAGFSVAAAPGERADAARYNVFSIVAADPAARITRYYGFDAATQLLMNVWTAGPDGKLNSGVRTKFSWKTSAGSITLQSVSISRAGVGILDFTVDSVSSVAAVDDNIFKVDARGK